MRKDKIRGVVKVKTENVRADLLNYVCYNVNQLIRPKILKFQV